jgi:hypothetical protein
VELSKSTGLGEWFIDEAIYRRARYALANDFNCGDAVAAHDMWWSWMSDHSARNLPSSADKSAGIAGPVNFYAAKTSQTGFLGLWGKKFML